MPGDVITIIIRYSYCHESLGISMGNFNILQELKLSTSKGHGRDVIDNGVYFCRIAADKKIKFIDVRHARIYRLGYRKLHKHFGYAGNDVCALTFYTIGKESDTYREI